MTQKLVSIIVPNYNSIAYIAETLESVFNQSYKPIEVVVVDDGSTDGSFEYLAQRNEANLRLVKNPSKGACAARNHGLRLAKGDYIQFLDADDLLSPQKIEAQVKLLEAHPNNVAVCSTVHFYEYPEDGKVVDKAFLYSTVQPQDFLLKLYGGDGQHHNMVAQHAWLTPRLIFDKAGSWDESLSKDQDGEYFCRVVMASNGVCYAPDVYSYYRKHIKADNVAGQKQKKHFMSQLDALYSKSQQFKGLEDTDAYKNAMALQYKIIAIGAYPDFKSISNKALHLSNHYGGSDYLPVLGGKSIEFLKNFFGWRFAKAFSVFVHKFTA